MYRCPPPRAPWLPAVSTQPSVAHHRRCVRACVVREGFEMTSAKQGLLTAGQASPRRRRPPRAAAGSGGNVTRRRASPACLAPLRWADWATACPADRARAGGAHKSRAAGVSPQRVSRSPTHQCCLHRGVF